MALMARNYGEEITAAASWPVRDFGEEGAGADKVAPLVSEREGKRKKGKGARAPAGLLPRKKMGREWACSGWLGRWPFSFFLFLFFF